MSIVLCIFSLIHAMSKMLQCLVFAQKLFIQECTCAYGTECIYALPVCVGGGGQGILKQTNNPRKDCP